MADNRPRQTQGGKTAAPKGSAAPSSSRASSSADTTSRPALGGKRTGAPAADQTAAPARAAAPSGSASLPTPKADRPFKVRATKMGYYGNLIRRVDDVFTIERASEFSNNWMERVDAHTPEVTTGSNAAIAREHSDLVGKSAAGGHMGDDGDVPTGAGNPLGDE